MFNSAHSPMSACCEKSLLHSHYFDSTFSTNLVTNGVCNPVVRMPSICSFMLTYFNAIAPLSTYSRVQLSLVSTYLVRPLNPTLEYAWMVPRLSQNLGVTSRQMPSPQNASYENRMVYTMHHCCPSCLRC